ncbi:hypothetical protein CONPUDRAFT_154594 [Coniophora puteana RWD-64-598 SS2]|uniref:Uncharacterized protein n=1 Tax=Coniophora puteana (strain RWD-64-598) TaxID=741705 RepID=A0A5M3MN16_CONPW|nr:uncharacterized protein CONPUDRAFT_154594 [Coniophora puteana RWD-64-598 SS2]EIW80568.1 hypothetical protein CONPUDRAFT_154594 [Coniophora puteana RWD-64-598 SS2]
MPGSSAFTSARDRRHFPATSRIDADPLGSVNVAQVCARWRHIAFSTPALWTHVKINAVIDHIDLVASLPLPIRPVQWAAPFSTFITLNLSSSRKLSHHPNVRFLPENELCGGVKGIDINGSWLLELPVLYQWLSQFSNLTHLTLAGVGLSIEWPLPIPSPCLDRLTHLHVCGAKHPMAVTDFIVERKWENLRSLVVDQPPLFLDEYLLPKLSTNIPNLTELFLVVKRLRSTWPRRQATMQHLQTLAVHGCVYEQEDETQLGPLFDAFTFPALTHLVVTGPGGGNIDFLRRFLVRSGCALSSLTFLPDLASDSVLSEAGLEDVKLQDTPIQQAALSLGKELSIPEVGFADSLEETKVYREAKQRWYNLDSSYINEGDGRVPVKLSVDCNLPSS